MGIILMRREGAEHVRCGVGVNSPDVSGHTGDGCMEYYETISIYSAPLFTLTCPFLPCLFLWNSLLQFKTSAGPNN